MSLCLAAAGLAVEIAASSFTLGWTHTIEKTRWEEDWRIEAGRLVLTEARIQGTGAGMETPPDATLAADFYVWRPEGRELSELVLRRMEGVGDWRLCAGGRCAPLAEWVGESDPVTMRPCRSPS
jgi:hypothetical protein